MVYIEELLARYNALFALTASFWLLPESYLSSLETSVLAIPIPVFSFSSQFHLSFTLYWAYATNGESNTLALPSENMADVASGFSNTQPGCGDLEGSVPSGCHL